jgi:hypothetical protein
VEQAGVFLCGMKWTRQGDIELDSINPRENIEHENEIISRGLSREYIKTK